MARKRKELPILEQVTITDVAAERKSFGKGKRHGYFCTLRSPR